MVEKKNGKAAGHEDIKVDYGNIDVEDIMTQIQEKIKASPAEHLNKELGTENEQPHAGSQNIESEDSSLEMSRAKKILVKIMKPFSPLIKFLVLPVHQQVLDTDWKLHQTNIRLDRLDTNVSNELLRLSQVLEKLEKRADTLERITDDIYDKLGRKMEYTKLLHGLVHNLVVELTKLKVEEDGLTIKTRILEKDFEFLKRKEKALEKKVFK